MKTLDRRDLFKSFGAAAVLLHPILSSRDVYAQAADKKRFFCMLTSSGVIQNVFWPKGNSGAYEFGGTTMEPLAAFKSDLTIARGFRNDFGPFDGHNSGACSLLTGNYSTYEDCRIGSKCSYNASIDQMLAKEYEGKTRVSSLVLGILPTVERPSKYISYDADCKMVPMTTNPYSVFDSVFKDFLNNCGNTGGSQGDAAQAARLLKQKKSVLDSILKDLASAGRITGLSASEKAKLDQYETSIRQMEKSLMADVPMVDNAPSCDALKKFAAAPRININGGNYPKVARLMLDLIAIAFQLDITRVATLTWDVGGSDGVPSSWLNFNGSPINESYHSLTHGQTDPANWVEKCKIIDKYHAEEYAYFLQQLKNSPEGSGNILDNSLALWSSELGTGNDHLPTNIPFVLAGKAGGKMKTGRYMQLPQTGHQGGMISIFNALSPSKKLDSLGRSGKIAETLA